MIKLTLLKTDRFYKQLWFWIIFLPLFKQIIIGDCFYIFITSFSIPLIFLMKVLFSCLMVDFFPPLLIIQNIQMCIWSGLA